MKKQQYAKIFLWIALLAVTLFIFGFSGQNAEESTDVSQGLLAKLLGIFPWFRSLPLEQQLAVLLRYDKPIRKTAHFCIYALLGFLAGFQSSLYGLKGKKQAGVVVPSTFLYACSDELHQRFVPGRSGQWSDVLLDTAGAITGYLLSLGLTRIWQTCNKNKKMMKEKI